jgi:hypothetical protein
MTCSTRRRSAVLPLSGALLAALAVPAVPAATAAAGPASGNAVLRWDAVAGDAALAIGLAPADNPLHESRMYAMTFLAVHDALNAVDRRYTSYALRGSVSAPGAAPDAAVAAAARGVLVPALRAVPASFAANADAAVDVVEKAYAAELARVPDGAAEDRGVRVGAEAAAAVLDAREGDGSDTPLFDFGYPQGTEPGEWRFTPDRPLAFAPGWAGVRPFALRSGGAGFHVRPPHPLGSTAYAKDLDEVKRLGGDGVTTPSARTADQTQAALFWLESSPLQWNRIARSTAQARGLDSWRSARLLAYLDMALADGYIASWSVKFTNPFWRPVTAIREAGTDGNPATTPDPTWTPLAVTPPIPDHDSAHAVEGGAAATVMARVFGTDRVRFSTCSLTLPDGQQCDDATPTTRSFGSFSQAATENAASRIWVGYHFRNASMTGLRHGRQVARLVMAGRLTPVG